jgi:hypothetical protein
MVHQPALASVCHTKAMTVSALTPWIVATALALLTALCGQLAQAYSGMLVLLDLSRLSWPDTDMARLRPRLERMRLLWYVLCACSGVASGVCVGLAAGWW